MKITLLKIPNDFFPTGSLDKYNGKVFKVEKYDKVYRKYHFKCDETNEYLILTESQLHEIFRKIDEGKNFDGNNLEYQPKHAKEGVEHPSHYNNEGGMECWDEMELIFGTEALMWWCLLSAWKYRYRMNDKDTPEKNMRKSNECIKKYKELKEKLEND